MLRRRADWIPPPIPAGGGVKVKVLEAMANGLGVVTTEVGAEGIPFTSGEHGFIARSDEEFVAQVLALLEDPELLREISLAAQQFVFEHFSAQAVYRDLDAVLAQPTREAVQQFGQEPQTTGKLVPAEAP